MRRNAHLLTLVFLIQKMILSRIIIRNWNVCFPDPECKTLKALILGPSSITRTWPPFHDAGGIDGPLRRPGDPAPCHGQPGKPGTGSVIGAGWAGSSWCMSLAHVGGGRLPMSLLFFGGAMNLAWAAAIAICWILSTGGFHRFFLGKVSGLIHEDFQSRIKQADQRRRT